jgi:iron(III) transport system substrate-binding protein
MPEQSTHFDTMAARETGRRSFIRAAIGVGALGFVPALAACARRKGAPRVVAYVSADDVLAREVLAACTAATGIEVDAVFDTEASKTTGLENRLRSESDRPRADLFWSSEGFSAVRLASAGVLAQLPDALWSSWPEAHRDADRRWLGFAARARAVAYAPSRGTPPIDDWRALAKPGVASGSRAAIAIADPRFGTTRGHLAALELAWANARKRDLDASALDAPTLDTPTLDAWLEGLRANGTIVLTGGNAATVEAVVTGECAYGLTDTDDVFAAQARGLSVEMTLPRSLDEGVAGGGTMLVPNTVSLVAGRDGPRADAERVAAWLVSPECEAIICRSPSRNLPLGPQASCDPGFKVDDPLAFEVKDIAGTADGTAVRALELLGRAR